MLSVSVCAAQTRPASVDEAGRTLERCLLEVQQLRATCHSFAEVRALEDRLKSANELLTAYKAEVERLTANEQSRTGIITARFAGYEARLKAYEEQVKTERVEAARLRKENGHLRKSRNVFVSILIGASVALAWALIAHGD